MNEEYIKVVARIAAALESIAESMKAAPSRGAESSGGKTRPIKEHKYEVTKCRDCDGAIVWVSTFKGKRMPVDADSYREGDGIYDKHKGHIAHWDNCRREKASTQGEDEADSFDKREEVPF